MSDYRVMANRQRIWMLILLIGSAVSILVTGKSTFSLGLTLGVAISFYNLWLLQRKTNLLAEAAEKEGKRIGIGTISRLAAAALGVLVAIKFELHIVAFVIGLMSSYVVIMLDFLLFNRK